jgi:cystathionine beta-synthase
MKMQLDETRNTSGSVKASADGILGLIGNTPLVALGHVGKELGHNIFAKLEFLSPSGSIKDRMAKYIIEDAEQSGVIRPGDLLIDNSSGNTAISVAMVGTCKGYRTLFAVPDKTSQEKIDLIRAFGSEVVICPTDVPHDHPDSYYQTARRLAKERPGFLVDQYHNPKNIECHFKTTGPEIWEQMGGEIDAVVAGIGTGGTLSGVARYLKRCDPRIRVIAVDPIGSIFYNLLKCNELIKPGRYHVEGIGTDVPCGAMDASVIDEVIQTDDQEAFAVARALVRREGLIVGGSSGSAVAGLLKWAKGQSRPLNIVTILTDTGMRYLSKFLSDDWMRKTGFEL